MTNVTVYLIHENVHKATGRTCPWTHHGDITDPIHLEGLFLFVFLDGNPFP
jgi:hypothetical protein